MLSFVFFQTDHLFQNTKNMSLMEKQKESIFPETVFLERACYHGKENLHFIFLKSWLTWLLAMRLPTSTESGGDL